MAPSYLRLVPTDARNFASFDPNKPVLLLFKVANLSEATAFIPTPSSPQSQADAMLGKLTGILLNTIVADPQGTAPDFNILSLNLAAPIDTTKGSFNTSIPSFDFTGLFNFITLYNFETLFNVLVIVGLLYLFFTPLADDDAATYGLFDPVDLAIPRGSDSNGFETTCCHCCNSATGMVRQGQPRKILSASSMKQVALVSLGESPPRTPVKRPSAPRRSQTTPAENLNHPLRLAKATVPPAPVDPKVTWPNAQTTRPNPSGIQRWQDSDVPCTESDTRRECFSPDFAQTSASSLSVVVTDTADPSEVHKKSSNPETVDVEDEADTEVCEEKGKEVTEIDRKYHQRAHPPAWEAISGTNEPVQKIIAPRVRATIPILNAGSQAQPPTRGAGAPVRGSVPPPVLQQASVHQPVVNVPSRAVPVDPIYIDVPMTQESPLISVPTQSFVPTILPTAPLSWLQQLAVDSNPYFPAQPAVFPTTIAPQLHVDRPTCAYVFTEHQAVYDQYMDITDADGDSWMRPIEFGEAVPLLEPAPQTLIHTIVTLTEIPPQRADEGGPTQQPTIVTYTPSPVVGQAGTLSGLDARRLHKKTCICRLPYGSHPSVSSLAPFSNRKVVRLCRSNGLKRGGSTFNPLSAWNKNLARASMLQKCFLLRKKVATRPHNPQYSEEPTLPRVDDQPKATDPTVPVNPVAPVDPAIPVDHPSPQKGRSYFDRRYAHRASPFSQRSPSEVSLMASKVIPKSASLRKAFIWQRHFAARDRRTAGTDGRISVTYQNDPTTGQQVVSGSQRQPAPLQRKAPAGDHVYPRRKRPTAADFIRAEDVEKEKEILDAAVDALQSMGLNPENSISVSSGSLSASDAFDTSLTTPSSPVTQDLEFHRDQAQLFLEDIFEDRERQSGPVATFSSSLSDPSSDLDSESDDD